MYDDYGTMLEGYDTVEASQGLSNDPLDAGWYAFEVAAVQSKDTTKNGVPRVKLQLKVTEGPSKGRSTFVQLYLGASKVTRRDGNEMERTTEEYEKARASVQGQMKGLMRALDTHTGAATGEGVDKVFNFYNVDQWQGKAFIGRVTLQPGGTNEATGRDYNAQNNLAEYYHVGDPKKGLSWLRARGNSAGVAGQVLGTVRV